MMLGFPGEQSQRMEQRMEAMDVSYIEDVTHLQLEIKSIAFQDGAML